MAAEFTIRKPMQTDPLQPETHPLLRYGTRRGWERTRTARFFEIPDSTFKQLVTGHTGPSFSRAEEWERLSSGEVTALDVMRWHERNRKRPSGEAAA